MHKKNIFITGGASGLGLALANEYAKKNYNICIGDISEEQGKDAAQKIHEQYAVEVKFLRCDVREEDDFIRVKTWIEQNWGHLDIVVNNAGLTMAGSVADCKVDDWNWILNVNLLGIVRGLRVFIPLLKKQQQGQIINIASLAGLIHYRNLGAYNSTKAAVVALSESLSYELAEFNIDVSVVCPSFFNSNLNQNGRAMSPEEKNAMNALLTKSVHGPEVIAKQIIKQAQNKKYLIFTDLLSRFAVFLKGIIPFSMHQKFVSYFFERDLSKCLGKLAKEPNYKMNFNE